MQMQLGIESRIPNGLLAANALLAENSRQGVPTSTQALYQGFQFAISSTYMGLQFRCYESVSGTVVAPNNGPSLLSSIFKDVKNCIANVALPTIKNDLNPFGIGIGSAADLASSASQANLAAAAVHSVQKGLTVPLRSSIVRAGVASAETLGEVSGILTAASVVYALDDAVVAEYKQCQ